MVVKAQARLQPSELPTWYEDGDGSLHSSADDVIHSKHPVGFNVMVPQDFVYLKNANTKKQGQIFRSKDDSVTTDLKLQLI